MDADLEANEVDERCEESNHSNTSHHGDVAERVPIEGEARWLWKEHRANEGAFRGVEASAKHHGESYGFVFCVVMGTSRSNDLRTAEEEGPCHIGVNRRNDQI